MGMTSLLVAAVMLVQFAAVEAFAADRHVSRRGHDTKPGGLGNDCLDAGAPCRSLDRAVIAATPGDVVKITGGQQHRARVFIDWPTTLTFEGGWDTSFTVRDPVAYPTLLRARSRRTPSGRDRRVFTVVAGNGETIAVTIDGVALRRGRAKTTLDTFDTFAISQDGGGGLAALAGTGGTVALDVRRSTIIDNRSARRAGGGVFLGASGGSSSLVASFDRSVIAVNKAEYAGGAEILGCGGPSCSVHVTMTNCVILGNRAEGSAAIHALSAGVTLDLVNTSVFGNRGQTDYADDPEGAIVVGSGALTHLTNTILWGNVLVPPAPGADLTLGPATVDIAYSDVGSVDAGSGVVNDLGGNLSVDPALVGFDLAAGSPLIDVGTCTGAPVVDFNGDPRPSGSGCDIGADEFVP